MKDNFKKLGKLFYDAPATPVVTEAAPAAPEVQAQQYVAPTPVSYEQYNQPIPNQQYLEILESAVQAEDLPGPDFLEFRKGVAALASVPMPENQKYFAAYATLSVQGLTPSTLKSSADHYISIIEREKIHFEEELADTRNEHVTTPTQLNEQRMQEIARINEEIQASLAKINEIQNDISSTQHEIATKSKEIDLISTSFKHTADYYVNQIKTDIQKIDTYILNNQPQQ
jgi:flagellar motility protein MotE (MotC chaperone)